MNSSRGFRIPDGETSRWRLGDEACRADEVEPRACQILAAEKRRVDGRPRRIPYASDSSSTTTTPANASRPVVIAAGRGHQRAAATDPIHGTATVQP